MPRRRSRARHARPTPAAQPIKGCMSGPPESIQPSKRQLRVARQRLGWRGEILLALLPTITVLIVIAVVERFSQQRLLFASLASSAFLIYLDPLHGTNSTRTLVIAQVGAALLGFAACAAFGAGYPAAAGAMLVTIAVMIGFDAVHPPAVATALSFAFREGPESNLLLFTIAVAMLAALVLLERASLWVMARSSGNTPLAPRTS